MRPCVHGFLSISHHWLQKKQGQATRLGKANGKGQQSRVSKLRTEKDCWHWYTYTFLINYLLLQNLLAMRARLWRLAWPIIIIVLWGSTNAFQLIGAAEAAVSILAEATRSTRLLLLEVCESCQDILRCCVGRLGRVAGAFWISAKGTATRCARGTRSGLLPEKVTTAGHDLVNLLQLLHQQVLLQAVTACRATAPIGRSRHHVRLCLWVTAGSAVIVHVVFCRVLRVLQMLLVHFSGLNFDQSR